MSDLFLLGAGFSKAICLEMPVLTELSEKVRERREIRDNPHLADTLVLADNIELWLTYLSQRQPWLSEAETLRNRAQLLELSRAIGETINECMIKVLHEACPDWLRKLVLWWNQKGAVVLTLNYDTLVERAASMRDDDAFTPPPIPTDRWTPIYPTSLLHVPIARGMVGGAYVEARFRLFKLHGSINWLYSGSHSHFGETIYHIGPYQWWHPALPVPEANVDALDTERAQMEWARKKVPLIIPPVAEKVPYFQHEVLQGVWSDAAEALENARRIFCVGYSLPETDLTMRLLLQTRHPQQRVPFYVVNRDGEVREHFNDILAADYETDFSFTPPECSSSSPVETMVDALVAGRFDDP
jgi:hypothetical protein